MSGTVRFIDIRRAEQVAVLGLDAASQPIVLDGSLPDNFLDRQVMAEPYGPVLTPETNGDDWLRALAEYFRYYIVGIYEPEGVAQRAWTPDDEAKHPREEAGAPGGKGGEFAHAWMTDEAQAIREQLLHGAITGVVDNAQPSLNRALIKFGMIGDIPVVLKGNDGPEEIEAGFVNKMMGGLVRTPVVTLRDTYWPHEADDSQVQVRAEGTRATQTLDWPKRVSPAVLLDAAVFDGVIGIADRHGGNWIVGPDNSVTLIDHGLIFYPSFYNDMVSNYQTAMQAQGNSPDTYGHRELQLPLEPRHVVALTRLKQRLRDGGRDRLLGMGVNKGRLDKAVQRANYMLRTGYVPLNWSEEIYRDEDIDA